jgi:hypothetical protein
MEHISKNQHNQAATQQFESFLKELEALAKLWGLIQPEKYKFRTK